MTAAAPEHTRRVPIFLTAGCAWLLIAAARAAGSSSTLEAAAAPAEVAVGEPMDYTMTLRVPEGSEADWAPLGTQLGDVGVDRCADDPPQRRDGALVYRRRCTLSGFVTGEHALPAPSAVVRERGGSERTVQGNAVTVTIKSLLPEDWASQDIRDVKPPIARWPLGWIAVFAVILAAAAAWWRFHRRRASDGIGPPPRPPHDVALEALERLRRGGLLSAQRYEEYYVRLSDVARRYVEGRFGLRAPEMTTEEFLQAALEAQALSSAHRQLLRQFLAQCDLVKFARYRPGEQEAGEAWEAAHRLVLETAPPKEPDPVAAAGHP